MVTKLTLCCCLVLCAVTDLCAQRFDAGGAAIGLSWTQIPSRSLRDSSGSFGLRTLALSARVPLFGNRSARAEDPANGALPHFYQVGIHGNFESIHAGIGLLKETDRSIYAVAAGINGLYYAGKKNVLMANVSIGMAAEDQLISNHQIRYRFSGLFMVNHFRDRSLSYQYGLVFTYAYGRPLPLPVLGIRKRFSSSWTLAALLPVSIQLTDRLAKNVSIGLHLRPSGNRFQLQNRQQFSSSSTDMYMQLRQFELGLNGNYRFARQFSVSAELGLLGKGKLKCTDADDRKIILSEASTQPGLRFRVGIRYHLPYKNAGTANSSDIDADMLRMN